MPVLFHVLALGLRNLGRNRRRSLSTMAAIIMGLVSLIMLNGFVNYSLWGLRESMVRGGLGHLQVAVSPEYFDEGEGNPFPYLLTRQKEMVRAIRKNPLVREVLPTIRFDALISTGKGSWSMVQVQAEDRSLAEEAYTFRTVDMDPEASQASQAGNGGIVLGQVLARKLGVQAGDSLEIKAMASHGGISTGLYTVTGTAGTGIEEVDARLVMMDLPAARDLLMCTTVPLLTVILERSDDTSLAAAELAASLAPFGAPTIRTWEELSPGWREASGTYRSIVQVAGLIVLLVSLFSISATLTMSVLERKREIGTLKALGTKPLRLFGLLVAEGTILGFSGAVLGCLAAALLAECINQAGGLPIGAQPGMSRAINIMIQPDLTGYLLAASSVVLAAAGGSVGPALGLVARKPASLLQSA